MQVCGIDLSAEMAERAHRLTPGIEFRQGDMMTLAISDETWAGIVAFYSIIHIPRDNVVQALSELRRVLRPGGLLLLSFHLGDDTIHLNDWWGQKVCVDFFFFRSAEMAGYLTSAGFEIEEIIERDPYFRRRAPESTKLHLRQTTAHVDSRLNCMRGVRISSLVEHPEYIPQLAHWLFEQWGSILGEQPLWLESRN